MLAQSRFSVSEKIAHAFYHHSLDIWHWNCSKMYKKQHTSNIMAQPYLGFGLKKEKISSEQQLCVQNGLIEAWGQKRMARLDCADRKATATQITTRYNQGRQKRISENTHNVEPWSRWATAAEDHTVYESCQWVYNAHRLTDRRLETCCLVWCVTISVRISHKHLSNGSTLCRCSNWYPACAIGNLDQYLLT